ncbi:hypothetical protein RhiJN_23578 [Ceratobasidium sp. AG-Ba]|nr:hypothetical protein RhiJN_23578 [Ceratobasidium sp. AG-Ba]
MTLQSGDYWLSSVYGSEEKGRLQVIQFYEKLVLVSYSYKQTVTVTKVGDDSSNKYTIQRPGNPKYYQPTDYGDGLRVEFLPDYYEWTITEVGPELYRISTGDKDISWQLNKNAGEDSSILLAVTDDTPGQLWFFSNPA